MAIRKFVKRTKPAVEDVEEEDDDVAAEAEDQEDDEEDDPKPAKRTARKVEVEVDEDDEDDEDDEPAPVKKVLKPLPVKKVVLPVKKAPAQVAKPVKKFTPVADDDDEDDVPAPVKAAPKTVKVNSVAETVATNLISDILGALQAGKSLTFTRNEDGNFTLVDTGAIKTGGRKQNNMTWAQYEETVLSEDYRTWREEFRAMTYEEKLKMAKKAGAKWEEHADQRINLMRVMDAYCDKKGIEKYKPEYADQATRKSLRSG